MTQTMTTTTTTRATEQPLTIVDQPTSSRLGARRKSLEKTLALLAIELENSLGSLSQLVGYASCCRFGLWRVD